MDNNALHDHYRKQLTNVHALTVLTISLFEIIGYIVLIYSQIEVFSFQNRYLWVGVVLPIAVNMLTHIIARIIVNRTNTRRHIKNAVIIAATLVTSLVVAVLHKEYIITSCAFVFPMVLSAMFNDRKLLNASLIASLFILVCVAIAFEIDATSTLITALNLFVLFAFAIVSYLCGVISINFSKLNYTTIQAQSESNDKLRDGIQRDQMTGLYNHTAFVTKLDNLIAHGAGNAPFCVVMIDVDNFKRINDSFGHDCGDEVLIYLADSMRKHCDCNDIPCRYGGEEFAIVFQQKHMDTVYAVMNALLENFRSHRFSFTDTPITFSAGIAQYAAGMPRDAFFELADKTLYTAKKTGKNRILKSE